MGSSVLAWLKRASTPEAMRALRHLVGFGASTGVSQVCGLISFLIVVNSLSLEDYGAYSFLLAIGAFLQTILPMGTTLVIVQDGSSGRTPIDELWSSQITIIAGVAITSAVLLAGALTVMHPLSPAEMTAMAGIFTASVATAMSPFPFLDVAKRQTQGALISAASDALGLVAVVVARALGVLSLPFLGLLLAFRQIAATGAQHGYYRAFVHALKWRPSPGTLKRLFALSWPVMLSAFLVQVPIQGGLVQVRTFLGEAEAGVFAVAAQALSACVILGLVAIRVLHPHIAGPRGWTPAFLRKLAGFLVCYCVGSAGAVFLLFTWLINRRMPEGYATAHQLLPTQVTIGMVIVLHSFVDLYLLTLGRSHSIFWIHGAKAIVYVAATTWVAGEYGSLAIAQAGLAACGLGLAMAVATLIVATRGRGDRFHGVPPE